MRVLLLFLLAITIVGSVVCSVPDCQRNATIFARTNLFTRLGCGYDPKRVTAFHRGYLAPVIALKDGGQTLKLPEPSTLTVHLPCEASRSYNTIHGSHRFGIDQVITNYSVFKRVLTSTGKVGIARATDAADFLVASASAGYSITMNSLLEQRSVTVLQYRSYRQAEVSLPAAVNTPAETASVLTWWDRDFADAVEVLDSTRSSHSSYSRLIDTFGTHVVSHLVIGGYIAIQADMDYCEYQRDKQVEGAAELRGKLFKGLSLKAQVEAKLNISSSPVTEKLTSFTSSNRRGGDDTAYMKTGDINQYVAGTAKENKPAIIPQETQFIEIWKLLPESDNRRSLLKEAVEDYLGTLPKPSMNKFCSSSGTRPAWLSPLCFLFALISFHVLI